jgi:hypothetical protein
MSPPISELEQTLVRLIQEHRALLECLIAHQAAMKAMDPPAMERAGRRQETARLRIASLEQRRTVLTAQRARELRLAGKVTLADLAKADRQRGAALLKLRNELKQAVEDVSRRSQVASRLAAAVLGHLNTAMRLLGGAMEQAGVYTKSGSPRVSGRIGVMEAVG